MPRRNRQTNIIRQIITVGFCNKRRFKTQKEAEAAKEIQELQDMSLELSTYLCDRPGCRGWHLTRSKH